MSGLRVAAAGALILVVLMCFAGAARPAFADDSCPVLVLNASDSRAEYRVDPRTWTVEKRIQPIQWGQVVRSFDGAYSVYRLRQDDCNCGPGPVFRLVVERTADGRLTILADRLAGADYAWSPDGKRLLYSWWTAESDATQLNISDPEGGNLLTLPVKRLIAFYGWSPDGQYVAYATWGTRGDLTFNFWSVPDGRVTSVSLGERIALMEEAPGVGEWSPSGRYFAVARWAEGGLSRMHLIAFDGPNGATRIIRTVLGSAIAQDVQWSPDGQYVAFLSDRDDWTGERIERLAIVGTDGMVIPDILDSGRYLTPFPVRWRADSRGILMAQPRPGAYFAYFSRFNVFEFDLTTRQHHLLLPDVLVVVTGEDVQLDYPGAHYSLVLRVEADDRTAKVDIYDSVARRRVPMIEGTTNVFLRWTLPTPGRERHVVAWATGTASDQRVTITVANGDGSGRRDFADAGLHQISGIRVVRDGSAMRYVATREDGERLERLDLQTGTRQTLIDAPTLHTVRRIGIYPQFWVWGDYAKVAFVAITANEPPQLTLIAGGRRRVLGYVQPLSANWSPDGKWLVVTYLRSSALSYPIRRMVTAVDFFDERGVLARSLTFAEQYGQAAWQECQP